MLNRIIEFIRVGVIQTLLGHRESLCNGYTDRVRVGLNPSKSQIKEKANE
jgi:hypothetical protein